MRVTWKDRIALLIVAAFLVMFGFATCEKAQAHEPYMIRHIEKIPPHHERIDGPYNMWLLVLDEKGKYCQVIFLHENKMHAGRIYECEPPEGD